MTEVVLKIHLTSKKLWQENLVKDFSQNLFQTK